MNLSIIDKQKNLRRPYVHVATLDFANSSSTDREEIRIGVYDLWIYAIYVTGYSSDGYRLDKVATPKDLFKMSIYDDSGNQFQVDPIVMESYNKLNQLPAFRGFHFKAQSKVTVDASAIGFPAGGTITYPAKYKVHFFGYRLDNYKEENQAAEALGRIKQPYTFTREFDLAANTSTDSDTIDTGGEDFFVESIRTFGLDTIGNVLEEITTLQDVLSFKMSHGEEQFQDNYIDILAINEAMQSIHWKGWYLEKKRTLLIEAKAETFPAAAVGTFPKKFHLNLTGYKLK